MLYETKLRLGPFVLALLLLAVNVGALHVDLSRKRELVTGRSTSSSLRVQQKGSVGVFGRQVDTGCHHEGFALCHDDNFCCVQGSVCSRDADGSPKCSIGDPDRNDDDSKDDDHGDGNDDDDGDDHGHGNDDSDDDNHPHDEPGDDHGSHSGSSGSYYTSSSSSSSSSSHESASASTTHSAGIGGSAGSNAASTSPDFSVATGATALNSGAAGGAQFNARLVLFSIVVGFIM
ncbi:hypothetical protein BDN72DRAFT_895961 [Pluteus cervinus]|uniref:Uncharacterized protein n=1 Tax=Pluteus cervinus TaxID=181527 RepID=A0ACD3B050_9AGAR|nr:hypothetical protein BDN72DRAFT_895961 [Pluteus cervinus]